MRAVDLHAPEGEQALGELLGRYLSALKTHLTQARKLTPDYADDIVQGFVMDKILRGQLLAHANESRGRFRTFLLTALDRYMFNQFRRDLARRRAPEGGPPIPLDGIQDLVGVPPASPFFDMAWIREIIDETLRRVKQDCNSVHRRRYWTLFEDRIVNPLLTGQEARPYRRLVSELGFSSPMQASNALVTVKRMFIRIFRDVVREYANDEQSVDREIEELRAILSEHSVYQQGRGPR